MVQYLFCFEKFEVARVCTRVGDGDAVVGTLLVPARSEIILPHLDSVPILCSYAAR